MPVSFDLAALKPFVLIVAVSTLATACGGGAEPSPEPMLQSQAVAGADIQSGVSMAAEKSVAMAGVGLSYLNSPVDPLRASLARSGRTTQQDVAPLTRFEAGEYLESSNGGQGETLQGVAMQQPPEGGSTYDTNPGTLTIDYQGGSDADRIARIIPDPTDPTNNVLNLWLNRANVPDANGTPTRGRVQLNAYSTNLVRAREVRFTARMFLGADFELLRSYPNSFSFLTISEWWNNGSWTGEPFPFRVTVNIVKPSNRRLSALRFGASATTFDSESRTWSAPVWSKTNGDVEVPIGRWVTVDYYIREGRSGQGRFYMAIRQDNGQTNVVFDIRDSTHHPLDPAPDGLTKLNPIKLYTASVLIDHVRNRGGVLQSSWDDLTFLLCLDLQPESSSTCAPQPAV